MGHKGPVLKPMCIEPNRAPTQIPLTIVLIPPENTDNYFIQPCKYYRVGSNSYGSHVRRQFGISVEWQTLNGRLEGANMSEAVSAAGKDTYLYDKSYLFCHPKYRVIRNDCRGFNNLPPRSPDASPM